MTFLVEKSSSFLTIKKGENEMNEKKVSQKLLRIIALYAGFCLVVNLAILYFEATIEISVLFNLTLLVGWLYFCILQCKVQHYENMKQQRSLLRSVEPSPAGAMAGYSISQDIFQFRKSFPLIMKIINFLEGKNE